MEQAVLVYQAGIANVFEVQCLNMADFGREARRFYQGDFKTAEAIARGLALAGVLVASMFCNEAGDVLHSRWSSDLDQAPFSAEMRPVWHGVSSETWVVFERGGCQS